MLVPFDCPHCGKEILGELGGADEPATCAGCGKSSPVPKVGLGPGVVIGGFRIDTAAGRSSLGDVYIAYQQSMERPVRIEILTGMKAADPETFGRFQREVKLTASLQHPNLLPAISAGTDNNLHFLVTQYREGKTLEEILQAEKTMSLERALDLLIPIAKALDFAFTEKQLLHRNIQPCNILLTTDGVPVLTDLGIAKSLSEDEGTGLTVAGYTVGTPEYMSPEQARADLALDHRSDIYSLFIVLYECVTGVVPFKDTSPILVMRQQIDEPHVPANRRNTALSAACSELIDRGLEKNPADRFESWSDVIEGLKTLRKGGGPAKPAAAAPEKPKKKPTGGQPRKKTAPPANGGRMSPDEIRKMAEEMYKPNPIRTIMLYAASILIPVGIFIFFAMKRNAPPPAPTTPPPTQATAPTPTQPPVTPTSANPTSGTAPTTTAVNELKDMYDFAQEFAAANPDNYEESIRKMTLVRDQAVGTRYYLMADDAIRAIETKRDTAVATARTNLQQQLSELAKAGNYAAAITLVEAYDGPFADHLADTRQQWAARLRERQALADSEAADTMKAIDERLVKWRRSAAESLLSGNADAVKRSLAEGNADPLLAGVRGEVAELERFAQKLSQLDSHVLATFTADKGKTLDVDLKTGRVSLLIRDVERGKIVTERLINNGRNGGTATGSVTMRISPSELAIAEQARRLQRSADPHGRHLSAVLLWRADQKDQARTVLTALDDELARSLAAAMD